MRSILVNCPTSGRLDQPLDLLIGRIAGRSPPGRPGDRCASVAERV